MVVCLSSPRSACLRPLPKKAAALAHLKDKVRLARRNRTVLRYGYVMAEADESVFEQHLGGRVPTGTIWVPGGLVSLGPNQTLRYEFDFNRLREKKPTATLLNTFISLWRDKKPRAVVAFAEKWGPLRLELPKMTPGRPWEEEPLAAWWFLSQRAHATLRIGQALGRNARGAVEDWSLLSTDYSGEDPKRAMFYGLPNWVRWENDDGAKRIGRSALEFERAQIGGELAHWMDLFGVRLSADWGGDGRYSWHLEVSYNRHQFLGAIALQLALSVADAESLFTCDGCGRPYIRSQRKPNAGQSNYCETCAQIRKPQREAEKRYRQNQRDARAMASAGVPIREIANTLNRRLTVVRSWLQKGK